MGQMPVLLPGGTDGQAPFEILAVIGRLEIGSRRILEVVRLSLMHPAEFVESRQAIAGRAGGKHTYGIFVTGMLLPLDFRNLATA
jgi:hypothetical protein